MKLLTKDSGSRDECNPLDVLLELFAEKVVQRLRGSIGSDWVAQATSPLGRRRHCAAVQRRLAAGMGGACIVGREHRLSPDALADELAFVSSRKAPKKRVSSSGVVADLERELRLVRRP